MVVILPQISGELRLAAVLGFDGSKRLCDLWGTSDMDNALSNSCWARNFPTTEQTRFTIRSSIKGRPEGSEFGLIFMSIASGVGGEINPIVGGAFDTLGTTDYRDGNWHHLLCVFVNTTEPLTGTLYVDGTLETIGGGFAGTISLDFSHDLYIGGEELGKFCTMTAADVMIWTA